MQCNDGEIRHLPFGVLEVVSPLGCAETPNDDVDGLQDCEYSYGEGHDSSYVISGEVDEDVVDALMDMEGEWPRPSLLDQPHSSGTSIPNMASSSAEGTVPVPGPPRNQRDNTEAPLQQSRSTRSQRGQNCVDSASSSYAPDIGVVIGAQSTCGPFTGKPPSLCRLSHADVLRCDSVSC